MMELNAKHQMAKVTTMMPFSPKEPLTAAWTRGMPLSAVAVAGSWT